MLTNPRWPVFIPSKSRADSGLTMKVLDQLGVPYRIIVEESQHDAYAAAWGAQRLLVLPTSFQDDYETCDSLGRSKSLGPGPARNYAWHVAQQEGAAWHWVIDDNVRVFYRSNRNRRIQVGDGAMFAAMEEFVLRYTNVAMAGPAYMMFAPSKQKYRPFITGTRIYSCNLIRTELPMRWRGRYNEDTDLSLTMLKAGWATVQFFAFQQEKVQTQKYAGGNTEAFYDVEGTAPKSAMLCTMHPDVAAPKWRFGRAHHIVDYSRWRDQPLIPDPDYERTTYTDREDWEPWLATHESEYGRSPWLSREPPSHVDRRRDGLGRGDDPPPDASWLRSRRR